MPLPRIPGPTAEWVLPPERVASICIAVGFRGEALVVALAVARAESGYDAHAANYSAAGGKWGPAVGLFQVRVLKDPAREASAMDRRRDLDAMRDPVNNARFAYDLSKGGRSWSSWSAYTNGAYRQYMSEARRVAANPAAHAEPGGAESVPLVANDWIDEDRAALPVVVGGAAAEGDLGQRVVTGRLDLSMAEASTAELELEDEHARLLRSRRITEGVPVRAAGQRMVITTIGTKQGHASPHVVLTAQPAGVVRLRGVVPVPVANTSAVAYARRLAKTAGLDFAGGPASPKIDVTPQPVDLAGSAAAAELDPQTGLAHGQRLENAWEVLRRLAKESTGYVCFESGGTLYFATQDWLYRRAGVVYVQVGDAKFTERPPVPAIRSIGQPTLTRTMRRDGQNRPYRHIDADILLPPGPGWKVRPGMRLWLAEPHGLVDDARPMLVQRAVIAMGDTTIPVRVSAASYSAPGDVESQPITAHDDGEQIGRTRSALDFVTLCLRQNGDRYVFGAETNLGDADPDAFDCSELVQWACAQVGVTIPDGSSNQRAHCNAIPVAQAAITRGALLFRPGHVAVSLGDGRNTIEAMGTQYGVRQGTIAGRFTSAGLIPGLRYQ